MSKLLNPKLPDKKLLEKLKKYDVSQKRYKTQAKKLGLLGFSNEQVNNIIFNQNSNNTVMLIFKLLEFT